ncbi:hypothetical protein GCM10012275_43170 [Longimycelium tulufanense]|uniref:Uncharacterized protein n=1 Tax=Longimycelium tulufanense TaxID=907463 RepID=A0A8J3FW10_9PSEU|nr:hypothetical protein [Longimycelium tulufanense]GGM67959.1 hypothetical protein GCM10012275_43170 [Longimycelium tulufanense]
MGVNWDEVRKFVQETNAQARPLPPELQAQVDQAEEYARTLDQQGRPVASEELQERYRHHIPGLPEDLNPYHEPRRENPPQQQD